VLRVLEVQIELGLVEHRVCPGRVLEGHACTDGHQTRHEQADRCMSLLDASHPAVSSAFWWCGKEGRFRALLLHLLRDQ